MPAVDMRAGCRTRAGETGWSTLDGKRMWRIRLGHVHHAALGIDAANVQMPLIRSLAIRPFVQERIVAEQERLLVSRALPKARGPSEGCRGVLCGATPADRSSLRGGIGGGVTSTGRHVAKHPKLQRTVAIFKVHARKVKVEESRVAWVKEWSREGILTLGGA